MSSYQQDIEAICGKLKTFLRALRRTDYPRAGISSHLGESFAVGRLIVGVSQAPYFNLGNKWRGRLLITAYWSGEDPRTSKQCERLKTAIGRMLKARCVEHWNSHCSMVFDSPCPRSLLSGQRNNKRLQNPFVLTPEEKDNWARFSQWLRTSLDRLRSAQPEEAEA